MAFLSRRRTHGVPSQGTTPELRRSLIVDLDESATAGNYAGGECEDDGPASDRIPAAHPNQELQCLFELAPIGPEDLPARCGDEGIGSWWTKDNGGPRMDSQGRVVLADPGLYFQYFYSDRSFLGIFFSALRAAVLGRNRGGGWGSGRPSSLNSSLVARLCMVWHRPQRPIVGVADNRASGNIDEPRAAGKGYGAVAVVM
ncbi:unnamed protein product, partial [Discosporangium mesarthrocarpum]